MLGNDETLLDKCLAVKRGDAENLLKNENLARARERVAGENSFAFGYVSPEGVAQIANLAGVSAAVETSEEDLSRSFIAKILPPFCRKRSEKFLDGAKNRAGNRRQNFYQDRCGNASVLKETLVS